MEMQLEDPKPTSGLDKIRMRLAAEGYKMMDEREDESQLGSTADSEYKKKSQGCTYTEKSMCSVIVVFIILLIVISALLVTQYVISDESFKKQTCGSPVCVMQSANFLNKMDMKTKPCDDFYKYSCGNWEEHLKIPPDKTRYTMFTDVAERNVALLRELLASNSTTLLGQESTAITKTKTLFKACMDIEAVEQRGTTAIKKRIKDLGSWTLTSGETGTWNDREWNLTNRITTLQLKGANVLFEMGVSKDLRNVEEHIINFDQGGLTFSDRSFYLEADISEKYYTAFRKYFCAMAVLLGADNSTCYEAAKDVWEFEKSIANITTPRSDRLDIEKLYHKMTVADLQDKIGSWINLAEYLQIMFGYRISPKREIVVYAVEFIRLVGELVLDTNHETLVNYMTWHGIRGSINRLPFPFRQASLALNKALTGVTALPPQWKHCVDECSGNIPQATGALYAEVNFTPKDKKKVHDILNMIKASFRDEVTKLDWMDPITKKRALEKVDAVHDQIGYPEMARDPPKLDEYYENLQITDDPLQNWINLNEYYVQKVFLKLSKKPDKTEWDMAPCEVNAYYKATTNQMVFPAGILQYPFYDPSYSMAMNFGAIGMVMGHELTHGFDNSGRLYDKDGNLNRWWEPDSSVKFLKKTKCIIDQFNQFKTAGKNLNGKLTQGENIADSGGLKTAYSAYQKWLHANGDIEQSSRLPALNMTEQQLFFLSFTQIWCSKYTNAYLERSRATNPHSPSDLRVIGTLRNIQGFSDAYNCWPGDKMTSQKQCNIW